MLRSYPVGGCQVDSIHPSQRVLSKANFIWAWYSGPIKPSRARRALQHTLWNWWQRFEGDLPARAPEPRLPHRCIASRGRCSPDKALAAIFFNSPRQCVGVVQARGLVEGNSLRRSSLPWNAESSSQLTGIRVWIRFNRTDLSHRPSTVRHHDDVAMTRARDESASGTFAVEPTRGGDTMPGAGCRSRSCSTYRVTAA